MTRLQLCFGIGLALASAANVAAVMAATPRAMKADKQAVHRSERVVHVIPTERQSVWQPTPATAGPAPQRIAQAKLSDDPPAVDREPPPLNEKDLLEPGQQIELPARRHYGHVGDVCARTGGRRVETHHGRSWRCVYTKR